MPNIWLTSDTHFGHDRDFVWGARGFNSIKEHDNEIIKRWNEVVQPGDTVYHLGDAMLGDNEHGLECLRQLNGEIHLALGNHCTDRRIELYKTLPNIVEIQMGYRIKSGKKSFILSHYPTIVSNGKDLTPVYCLCGHSHTTDKWLHWDLAKAYHVEMDAHNCYPVDIEQIKEDFRTKKMEENTNAQ